MSDSLKAVVLALLGFAIFATHDVVVKILGASYSPFQVVFFSVLLGFPLVTVMLLRDETVGTLIPVHPWWTALRTLAATLTAGAAFYAFANLPLAQTYAILFMSPLLITLLAIPILGERVGLRRGAAVLVGLLGVIVVLQPGTTDLSLGHIAALIAAFGSALASIIVRKIGRDERSVVLILYPMVSNFVLMGALMPVFYTPMPFADLALTLVIALFALTATACMIAAYKIGQAAMVAPMQYSQILWATGFGLLFFGEDPGWATAIGSAIIISSGVYIVLREGSGASANSPVIRTRSRTGTPAAPRLSQVMRKQGSLPDLPAPKDPSNRPRMRGITGRG